MGWFGFSKRKDLGPHYEARSFLTTDARQNALDDYHVVTTFQSGLAGLVPLFHMDAAQLPNGFDYTTNVVGYMGTPYPVVQNQPLVNQPQWAEIFLREASGLNVLL